MKNGIFGTPEGIQGIYEFLEVKGDDTLEREEFSLDIGTKLSLFFLIAFYVLLNATGQLGVWTDFPKQNNRRKEKIQNKWNLIKDNLEQGWTWRREDK